MGDLQCLARALLSSRRQQARVAPYEGTALRGLWFEQDVENARRLRESDKERSAEYGVGGGIVADSQCTDEWNESLIKSRALGARLPSFELLETMLWRPDTGYLLFGRHMKRLLQWADYFGFHIDVMDVRDRLERYAASLPATPHRVRLVATRRGAVEISSRPHDVDAGFPAIALAAAPIDSANPFLYHKTTNRTIYEDSIAARPGFDVLLDNERGEATESTIANLVVQIGGELLTPPIACGLLSGTLRAHLLDEERFGRRFSLLGM